MPGERARSLVVDMVAVVSLFLLAVLVANPAGDFPLNDDWSWAYAARTLAFEQVWRPTDWTGMPLITHAAWGALFCSAAGSCSGEVLRWSTIAAAAIALVGTYWLGRNLGVSRKIRLVLVATLAASPLFFGLSFSFMTDVSFVAIAAVAAVFYVRALKGGSNLSLAVATALTLAGALSRQVALFLPMAYLVAIMLRGRPRLSELVGALVSLALPAAAFLAFSAWMQAHALTPEMYSDLNNKLVEVVSDPLQLARNLPLHSIKVLMYAGLFCLPALLAQGRVNTAPPAWVSRLAWAGAAGFALLAAAYCAARGPMPVAGNILTTVGLGPHSIYPYSLQAPYAPAFDGVVAALWWGATAASIAGGAILVRRVLLVAAALTGLSGEQLDARTRALEAFVLAAAVIYAGPLLLTGFYDRYLLPLLILAPLIGASIGFTSARWGMQAALIALCGLAALSVGWTHDYMAWNRARWTAISQLEARGVPAFKMNGGFEYLGEICFTPRRICRFERGFEHAVDEAYLISFTQRANYRTLGTVRYSSWLPPARHEVLILEREVR